MAWFLAGGTLVFGPLLAAALLGAFLATRRPTLATMLEHLRVRPMSAHDWWLAGVVLLLVTVAAMVRPAGHQCEELAWAAGASSVMTV